MFKQIHTILTITVALCLIHVAHLNGQTKAAVEAYKSKEQTLSKKRFKKKEWLGKEPSNLTDKSFSFEHWNKHYSSLGSKKWTHKFEKSSDRKRFKTGLTGWFKKKKSIESSEWQGYLANLEDQAQISTDSTMRIYQDKRIYEKMLKKARNFKETGKDLSLRDINRFQFRKNRSEGDVPVTQAGSDNE